MIRLREFPPEAFGIKSPNPYGDPKVKYHIGGFDKRMSVEEAKLILGVDNLTIGEINKKHRQTMLSNHPDKGGSPYVAMKINEAKDVLEQQIPQKKRGLF